MNTELHNKRMKAYAKKFRNKLVRKATPVEKFIWNYIKLNKLDIKFQQIIYIYEHNIIKKFYIADFVYKNIIIEIDGGYHNIPSQKRKDKQRSKCLKEQGYKICRLNNEDIEQKGIELFIKCLNK